MLGFLRTFLALVVVAGHLWGIFLGVHAVYGFYVISGFLMTRIVNERYGYSLSGFSLYMLNRILRIYPAYWFACIAGLVLIFALGEWWTITFQRNLRLPEDARAWFTLFLNFYWYPDNASHLVPPSWAVAVEFLFFLLIGLGLGRNKLIVLVWLFMGVIYHGLALSWGWDRYASPLAAMLPYALGACLYHFRDIGHIWLSNNSRCLLAFLLPPYVLLMLSNPWVKSQDIQMTWVFYLGIALSTTIVAVLGKIRADSKLSRRDVAIGNLSYPIYLFHYFVGAITVAAIGLPAKSMMTFLSTLPLLLVVALTVARLNEATIETWRLRLAARARNSMLSSK